MVSAVHGPVGTGNDEWMEGSDLDPSGPELLKKCRWDIHSAKVVI